MWIPDTKGSTPLYAYWQVKEIHHFLMNLACTRICSRPAAVIVTIIVTIILMLIVTIYIAIIILIFITNLGMYPDLLATSGDYLRVWKVVDSENRQTEAR